MAKGRGMNATSPLTASALVFAGGGAGALLRYQTGRAMSHAFGPSANLDMVVTGHAGFAVCLRG